LCCYYRIHTYSIKIEGVQYRYKKRLDNPSESAQLVDCSNPCADRVVVLNVIISPKVKALLISILTHEPLRPDPFNKPKFNPDLKDVPEVYHEFADVFLGRKPILFCLIGIVI
jgi:hypothetical protein